MNSGKNPVNIGLIGYVYDVYGLSHPGVNIFPCKWNNQPFNC
jgi:hypothetical protein